MRILKIGLATAAVLAAAVVPASAEPTVATGFNNGDIGFVSVTAGAALGGARSATNPLDALVDAKCEFHQVTRPSSNEVVLVVAAHAVASPRNGGTDRAVATQVRCVLKNAFNGSVVVDQTRANEGSVAVWAHHQVTQATSFVVCAEARALYVSTAYVTTDAMHCIYPF